MMKQLTYDFWGEPASRQVCGKSDHVLFQDINAHFSLQIRKNRGYVSVRNMQISISHHYMTSVIHYEPLCDHY